MLRCLDTADHISWLYGEQEKRGSCPHKTFSLAGEKNIFKNHVSISLNFNDNALDECSDCHTSFFVLHKRTKTPGK